MNKGNVYNTAENLLDDFLLNKISKYSQYRNFDYGPDEPHKFVSGLSPYISKGVIKEEFLLKRISEAKNSSDKFIQEVLWRTYWKGWLEKHIGVWKDYKEEVFNCLKTINKSNLIEIYNEAINGQTKLEPYNEWIKQLKKTGYLHNHSRMWFASIWIHYFGLPWQLGAHLFYENLLDADISSNTLSWKWVAGLQTLEKKYIATKSNIMKFSLSRYKDFSLPQLKQTNLCYKKYDINEIEYDKKIISKNNKNALLVLENNLNFNFIQKNIDKTFVVILLKIENIYIKKNSIKDKFQYKCNVDFLDLCKKNKIAFRIFNISKSFKELIKYLENENIYSTFSDFITVGYERDHVLKLESSLKNRKIRHYQFLDQFYQDLWNYCDKGFFHFKKNLNKLAI